MARRTVLPPKDQPLALLAVSELQYFKYDVRVPAMKPPANVVLAGHPKHHAQGVQDVGLAALVRLAAVRFDRDGDGYLQQWHGGMLASAR